MTKKEKDEIITRVITYIINDKKRRDEIWRLLYEDMFRLMATVHKLEKQVEVKELDKMIKSKKSLGRGI
jgi:hypothetical protein